MYNEKGVYPDTVPLKRNDRAPTAGNYSYFFIKPKTDAWQEVSELEKEAGKHGAVLAVPTKKGVLITIANSDDEHFKEIYKDLKTEDITKKVMDFQRHNFNASIEYVLNNLNIDETRNLDFEWNINHLDYNEEEVRKNKLEKERIIRETLKEQEKEEKALEKIETRLSFLEGKTELSDEDIIHIIDLPRMKYELKNDRPEWITKKSYKELARNEEEKNQFIEKIKTKPEYLKYKNSFISKDKLLYQESGILCNEIPCIILLDKINKPGYLLPYNSAINNNNEQRKFADALQEDTFTEFKRVFNPNIKQAYLNGIKQSKNIFFLINNNKLNKDIIENQLKTYVENRKTNDKSGIYMFFSEKSFQVYSYEVEKNGKINEKKIYNLKEMRLAPRSKPIIINAELKNSPSISNNLPLNDNLVKQEINTKEIFNSLLSRGAIEILKKNRDIENSINRYMWTLSDFGEINENISSESIKLSNENFINNEQKSRAFQLWQKSIKNRDPNFEIETQNKDLFEFQKTEFEEENNLLKEKIKEQEELIKKQNQLLYGQCSIKVNGQDREIKKGLVNAFPNAVIKLDEANQKIQDLSQNKSINKKLNNSNGIEM
ncbi:MAG: hypothetical protein MJ184_06045 [Treponema sp.]|uniref:hypothetical protein n=1 Tax=Treponema sp. TaxID=166 RepID=UPI00298EA010|nr:hypothetical protein [Treponema sp.]MCQ2600907.1 hypothetical protein [Treponema sp.]